MIDFSQLKQNEFNLITAGCGTGKSHMVMNHLLPHFPGVEPYEVIFLTSRAATVRQQSLNTNVTRYSRQDEYITAYWNGDLIEDDELKDLSGYGISIMSYDKIIEILTKRNPLEKSVLVNAKIIILDECHTLFCDSFIVDINTVVRWIRDTLDLGSKTIIGMTATAGILRYHEKSGQGFILNELNKEPLMAYKTNQLICTDNASLPYLVSKCLSGRTMILCATIKQCMNLQSQIDNSAVLVSPYAKEFTRAMSEILNEIVINETVPNDFEYIDGTRKRLDVLICTSTLREGINLRKQSGIRNVICCFSDELHIIQFVGRCRYDIDCAVVTNTFIRSANYHQDPYITEQRNAFREYEKNRTSTCWFDSIAHIVKHDITGVKWFSHSSDDDRFTNYINSKWLLPNGISKKGINAYMIYREEDEQEIIAMAVSCNVVHVPKSKLNFNRIMRMLKEKYGYEVKSGQIKLGSVRQSYKLVISFKPNQPIEYEPERN